MWRMPELDESRAEGLRGRLGEREVDFVDGAEGGEVGGEVGGGGDKCEVTDE